MNTKTPPRSQDCSTIADKQFVSDDISHRDKSASKFYAVLNLFVIERLLRSGKHRATEIALWFMVTFLLMVVLLHFTLQNSMLGENKLSDSLKLNEIHEKSYSLHFDKERQELQVSGIMEIGILPAFKNMLLKHPESKAVMFNSNGGNIYQARGLAKVIMAKALNTYVSEDCYSACTIAYVAGKVRYMGPNGRLGFHQYNMKSKLLNQLFNIEKEQAKDLSFFRSRISDNMFIEKIFNAEHSDLWIPEQKDLLKAGVIHEIIPELER